MNAFFMGAGASCGTLQDSEHRPPVAANFGSALKVAAPEWESQYPGLRDVVRHLGIPLEELGLERMWTTIDYYAKLGSLLPVCPQWGPLATRDLKRALLELYGSRCDRLASMLPLSDNYTLGQILKQRVRSGDLLVSFNYDTLIERLALRFGHNIGMALAKCGGDVVQLAKPHGSVSWRMEWASRRVFSTGVDGGPLIEALNESEVGAEVEPLLLGAVPIKSELIREVQERYSWPEVFETVARQWQLVARAVRDAQSFIIIGYSFPREDQYGRFLLTEAMRLRTSLPDVEFFELPDVEDCTKQAIRDAFGCQELQPKPQGKVSPPPT